MELQPHQQRVINEKAELDARLESLLNFLNSETFAGLPEAEQARMRCQSFFMRGLASVLADRISAFITIVGSKQ